MMGNVVSFVLLCQREGLHQLHDRLYTKKCWQSDALISPALVIRYFGRTEAGIREGARCHTFESLTHTIYVRMLYDFFYDLKHLFRTKFLWRSATPQRSQIKKDL